MIRILRFCAISAVLATVAPSSARTQDASGESGPASARFASRAASIAESLPLEQRPDYLKRALAEQASAGVPSNFRSALLIPLANSYQQLHDGANEAAARAELVDIWTGFAGANSVLTASYKLHYGEALIRAKRYEEAEKSLNEVLEIYRDRDVNEHAIAWAKRSVAPALEKEGKTDQAAAVRAEAERVEPAAPHESADERAAHNRTYPHVRHQANPEYSEEARKKKYSGTVLLRMTVEPDGKPSDIRVVVPLGLGLDEKAIQAVKKWRFDPGTKDGNPVAVTATIEINFMLL